MSGSFEVLGPRSLFDREGWDRFKAQPQSRGRQAKELDMPEKKTSGIIVPVPELSREARCALAFSQGAPKTDVAETDPIPTHEVRTELLKVATLAIERAIDGAVSQYREAMREKYSSPTTVGEEVDAERAAAAEKEVAISGMEQAHKKPGLFGR